MVRSLLFGSLLTAAFSSAAQAADVPSVRHVMVVVFENANYDSVMAAPYFARFAGSGALATNLRAETHPSQGNYVALTSGDLHGVHSDANVDLDVRHIGDLLEEAGKTWKVYAENYPGNCFKGAFSGDYARKHNPFISYLNVQNDADRCAKIVDASELDQDKNAGTLPDFMFYVPNQKNDGHDTGVDYADRWFQRRFEPLLADPRFSDGTLTIATYDESSLLSATNQIYTALVGPMVQSGARYTARADHYSLLRTIELALGLGDLGGRDAAATPLSGIWK